MWTIIKVDLKNLEFLKNEFKKKSRRGCKNLLTKTLY